MHDFDAVRAERENADRTFRIGGEEFTFRAYIHPNHVLELQEALTTNDREYLAVADRIVPGEFLEPGQEKNWAKVRDPKAEKPLSIWDVIGVINYVLAVATGRPTVPSPDSSATPPPTGTPSTERSRSRASLSAA